MHEFVFNRSSIPPSIPLRGKYLSEKNLILLNGIWYWLLSHWYWKWKYVPKCAVKWGKCSKCSFFLFSLSFRNRMISPSRPRINTSLWIAKKIIFLHLQYILIKQLSSKTQFMHCVFFSESGEICRQFSCFLNTLQIYTYWFLESPSTFYFDSLDSRLDDKFRRKFITLPFNFFRSGREGEAALKTS